MVTNVYKYVHKHLSQNPDRIAIQHFIEKKKNTITAGSLIKRIDHFAHTLTEYGFSRGHRIGILSENSIDWVATYLALNKIGVTAVLLDKNEQPTVITSLVQQTHLNGIIVSPSYQDKCSLINKNTLVLRMDKSYQALNRNGEKDYLRKNILDIVCKKISTVVFTSGTTGAFKAVALSHKNIIKGITNLPKCINQKIFTILPWFHCYGLSSGCLALLINSAEIEIVDKMEWPDIQNLLHEAKPDTIVCVPRFIELITTNISQNIKKQSSQKQKLFHLLFSFCSFTRKFFKINFGPIFFRKIFQQFGGKVRVIYSGGAPLSLDSIQFFAGLGFSIYQGYGLSETFGCVVLSTKNDPIRSRIGKPVGDHQIDIIFPNESHVGEVCVHGSQVMLGYLKDNGIDNSMLKNGWFATGDLALRDEENNIVLAGRSKDMIVTAGGKKFMPGRLQPYLDKVEDVEEITVIGVPKQAGEYDEVCVVAVIKKSLSKDKSIQSKIKKSVFKSIEHLPEYMQAKHIYFVDALPKTSTLKIVRLKLIEKILEIRQKPDYSEESVEKVDVSADHKAQDLIQLLASVLNIDQKQIHANYYLSELSIDSFLAIQIVNEVNQKYPHANLTLEVLFSNPTVLGLSEYIHGDRSKITIVEQAVPGKTEPEKQQIQLNEKPVSLNIENVFLTGATGILGSYLVKNLLESTNAKLYCLIRGKDENQARERVKKFVQAYDDNKALLSLMDSDRFIPILGDITEDYFGLTRAAYDKLCQQIDLVMHCAASTSLHGLYSQVVDINVHGTQRVIDFALQTTQKYFLFVSTYTVMGDRQWKNLPPFTEADSDLGQKFINMGYQQSKFEGEQLVRESQHKGLNWIIVRPGDIFGDSQTGHYPLFDPKLAGLFYDILKTVVDTKVGMVSPIYFDMTPIDYVAKAITYLSMNYGKVYGTFHLVNPYPHRYYEILFSIRDCGYDIQMVSTQEYLQKLQHHQLLKNGKEYQSATLNLLRLQPSFIAANESSYASAQYTKRVLANANIVCLPPDQNLLGKYLEYCERVGYLRQKT